MKKILGIIGVIAVFCCAAAAQMQEKAAAPATLKVADARLGTAVENKQIVGEDSTFVLNTKVYLWMKVTGGPADSLTVTWKNDTHVYTAKLGIGGSPWRTWAYKTAAWPGAWTVTVEDGAGTLLKEMAFTVKAAPAAEPMK